MGDAELPNRGHEAERFMAEAANERFSSRRKYEWQMNLALWTALASGTAFVIRGEAQVRLAPAILITILCVAILFAYVFIWRIPLERRNRSDRDQELYWQLYYSRGAGIEEIADRVMKHPKAARGMSDLDNYELPEICKDDLLRGWDFRPFKKKYWRDLGEWFNWAVSYQCVVTLLLTIGFVGGIWVAFAQG